MRVLVAIVLLVSLPSAAIAQDARALLEEGVSLRQDGRDEEALERFRQAYEADHSAEALAQVALAEQALGQLPEAEAHLREALSGDQDEFIARYQMVLEQALTEIGTRLGSLTLIGGPDGAAVRIAGRVRGQLPFSEPLRVVGGSVHVEVQQDGFIPLLRDVEVPAEGQASLAVEMVPLPSAVPAPEPEPSEPQAESGGEWPWTMTVGVIAAGAGVVALAIASGLMAVREQNAQARLNCSDTNPACRDHFYAAVDFERAAVATFIAGGVLLAGGATLFTIGLTSPSADQPSAEQPSVACAPTGLGMACAGRF